jgi:hypothetical protein
MRIIRLGEEAVLCVQGTGSRLSAGDTFIFQHGMGGDGCRAQ